MSILVKLVLVCTKLKPETSVKALTYTGCAFKVCTVAAIVGGVPVPLNVKGLDAVVVRAKVVDEPDGTAANMT